MELSKCSAACKYEHAVAFYRHLGYDIDGVVSMGKRLVDDAPPE